MPGWHAAPGVPLGANCTIRAPCDSTMGHARGEALPEMSEEQVIIPIIHHMPRRHRNKEQAAEHSSVCTSVFLSYLSAYGIEEGSASLFLLPHALSS